MHCGPKKGSYETIRNLWLKIEGNGTCMSGVGRGGRLNTGKNMILVISQPGTKKGLWFGEMLGEGRIENATVVRKNG